MRAIILPDKASIIPFVSRSELTEEERNNLNTAFTEPQTETDWILLAELWNSIHIVHRIKVFNLLNESTRDSIGQRYGQTEEIIDCNEHDPFGGINPYESFNSAAILVPVSIPADPSPTAFLAEVAQGTAKTFSDYYAEGTIMGKHKKTGEEKERDNKRMIYQNVAGRKLWSAKHGDGNEYDYTKWRFYEPTDEQVATIETLLEEGKFTSDAFQNNKLVALFPRNTRLSDNALSLVYRAGITNKQCGRWWPLDFNSSGAPLCSPLRHQMGRPSLASNGKVYQIWYGDRFKKTAYVLHGDNPAEPTTLPPVDLLRPGLKTQSSDPATAVTNDNTVSSGTDELQPKQGKARLGEKGKGKEVATVSSPRSAVSNPNTPIIIEQNTGETYGYVYPSRHHNLPSSPPLSGYVQLATAARLSPMIPAHTSQRGSILSKPAPAPPKIMPTIETAVTEIDEMPDIDDSDNEAGVATVQDRLLEDTRAALALTLEENAANLQLARIKLQATVRVARGLDENQLNLGKSFVNLYNAVRTATSSKPTTVQEFSRIWDDLREVKEVTKPVVHAVNKERNEISRGLNNLPATKSRIFNHEYETSDWLNQTESWRLLDEGDRMDEVSETTELAAGRKRGFGSVD